MCSSVLAVLALCLGANGLSAAATLAGTVTNGTTGRPAAGAAVALLADDAELEGVKTDTRGRFRFTVAGSQAPHLVRVVHQGVAYDQVAMSGVNSIDLTIYDVTALLDGLTAVMGVQRFQTQGDTLEVVEQIVLRNASRPPRTLMNGRPFEMQLPPEAQLESGIVQAAGAQPLTYKPTPGGAHGRYQFPGVPLRPGETRFAVGYRLPYRGEAVIEPTILYPVKQFAVVLPKSLKFEVITGDVFRPMPGKTDAQVLVTAAVKPGQPLSFRVSGTGTLAEPEGRQQPAQSAGTARPSAVPRPPARSGDPSPGDRGFRLGGLGLVLAAAAAGFLAHKRKQPRRVSA